MKKFYFYFIPSFYLILDDVFPYQNLIKIFLARQIEKEKAMERRKPTQVQRLPNSQ